jgi:murein DD-endopeptidase MepM/ murein hydrolase activator NlpD
MDRVTLILVPDELSRVRRVQVPRALISYGLWALAGLSLLLAVALTDWVRLRIAAYDVAAMRAQTTRDQAELADLARKVESLDEKLGGLAAFEQKVRVIADLPATLPKAAIPEQLGARRIGELGQGGAEQSEAEVEADVASPSAPPEPASPAAGAARRRSRGGVGLDQSALDRIRHKVERVAAHVELRSGTLADLVARLEGLRERLAATPSIWPTNGWVTSRFGWRISPFTGRRQFHSGLDIAADVGTDIVAAARGKVVFAGSRGPLGRAVILDHGFGFRTVYGHASALHVRVGQSVERGERVATVGSSGRSTGPHVHYAVLRKGHLVNPAQYVID